VKRDSEVWNKSDFGLIPGLCHRCVKVHSGRRMKNISIAVAAGLLLFNSMFAFGDDKPNSADPRQVAITVGRLLEQGHYSRQKLDAEMSKRILETYLENLDYNKLFFTQEDVDHFTQKYGANLGDSILLGDLRPAQEIYSVFKGITPSRAVEQLLWTGEKNRGRPIALTPIPSGKTESRGNCSRRN
jgi:hypothetical protein